MNKILLIILLLSSTPILTSYLFRQQANQQFLSSQLPSENAVALCREATDKRDMYFGIWKKQFLERNGMEQSFFDKHVLVDKYDVECQWASGLSLRVEYRVTYDWAVINQHDQIVIALYSQEEAYRHLPIQRDQLLTEEEVSYMLDESVFSSITPIKDLDKMKFSSYEDAAKAFKEKIGTEDLENVRLSFYVPGKVPRQDGHPYMIGWGVIDGNRNLCISGYMNLVTGESEAHETACVVS